MGFATERLEINGLQAIRLKDTTGRAIAGILPDYGALLHQFLVASASGEINVIDHYPDRTTLEAELGLSYKSAKLSPFVCRTARGKYEWGGKTLEFRHKFVDGSAIHGLLYNRPFTVVGLFADEQTASVQLRYHYRGDDPGYPFHYNCEVVYRLMPGNLLELETTILNLSQEPLPLADGWHPYFTLGGPIDRCKLQVNSSRMLEFNDALLPTGNLLNDRRFTEPAELAGIQLDNCFLLNAPDGQPCCSLVNPANGLRLSITTNETYPYLQLYTPPHRNSIAIENLSGAPDCLNNGMGIVLLEPGESETFTTWYKIDTVKID